MLIKMFQEYANHAGVAGPLSILLPELPAFSNSSMLPAVGRGGKSLEVGPLAGRAVDLHLLFRMSWSHKSHISQTDLIANNLTMGHKIEVGKQRGERNDRA